MQRHTWDGKVWGLMHVFVWRRTKKVLHWWWLPALCRKWNACSLIVSCQLECLPSQVSPPLVALPWSLCDAFACFCVKKNQRSFTDDGSQHFAENGMHAAYITRKSKAQSILHEHLASRKFKIIIIYMRNIYLKIFNGVWDWYF